MAISAGSFWVDGLQEFLRVPWHLFRWVKEGAAVCLIQHFIKSSQPLSPLVDKLWPVPRMEPLWARTPLPTPDLASSCSGAWLCWNTTGNCSPGVLTPDLWVLQGDGSHASGLKGQEILTGFAWQKARQDQLPSTHSTMWTSLQCRLWTTLAKLLLTAPRAEPLVPFAY